MGGHIQPAPAHMPVHVGITPYCSLRTTHPRTPSPPSLASSLDRVNASRNFTNKLWNAGKFVLFNLDKVRRRGQ